MPTEPLYPQLVLENPCLIRYYQMTELTGTTAIDSTGTENGSYSTGTYAPTLGQPGIPSGGTSVLFNGGLSDVSGHTSYMLVPQFETGGSVGFTMECWIFFPTNRPGQNSQIMAFSTSDGGSFSGVMAMNNTNGISFSAYPGSGTVNSNGNLTGGVWNYLVATVAANGSILLYVQAVQQTETATIATPYNLANELPLYVGGGAVYADDSTFQICNVAIYNCVLSPTVISGHYTTGGAAPAFLTDGVGEAAQAPAYYAY